MLDWFNSKTILSWLQKFFGRQPMDDAPPPVPVIVPLQAVNPHAQDSVLNHLPSSRHGASGAKLPRFQSAAADFADDLDQGGAISRKKVRDAFSPSQPITNPELLAGRTQALHTLIRSIEDLKLHVCIYGERGIGKTSLLHILKQLAENAKYHVIYHSCGEDSDFSETFRIITGEIPTLYHSSHDPAAIGRNASQSIASLLPAEDFNVSQLTDLFAEVVNTRVLILLDEFDRSPPGVFRRSIAQLIKNLSDRSVPVQLVIAGVAGNLADLIEHIPSIRRNLLGFRVPEMEPAEVEEMVAIGEDLSGLHFTPEACDAIIKMANGSPYLASLLSQYAAFSALDNEASEINAGHVKAATEQVAYELKVRLTESTVGQINRALIDGWKAPLLSLGNHAMHSMGCLDRDDFHEGIAGQPFDKVIEGISMYGIIQPAFDEKQGRYRFCEEGIPSFLWLSLANDATSDVVTPVQNAVPVTPHP